MSNCYEMSSSLPIQQKYRPITRCKLHLTSHNIIVDKFIFITVIAGVKAIQYAHAYFNDMYSRYSKMFGIVIHLHT